MLLYIGSGNERLLSYDFQGALEDFEMASELIEDRLKNRYVEMDVLILFGRIIAYDNLGFIEATQDALVSLFTLMIDDDDEEEDDEETEFEGYSEYEESGRETLLALANLARSPNIRELLVKIFSDD